VGFGRSGRCVCDLVCDLACFIFDSVFNFLKVLGPWY
jgi:hypothetical protein